MNFSDALTALKDGKLLRRAGWNGKDAFVFLVQGSVFEVNRAPLLGIFPEGTRIQYAPHIDMRTTSGVIVPWNCSQSDVMAEDWEVVETMVLNIVRGAPTDGKLHSGAFAGDALT